MKTNDPKQTPDPSHTDIPNTSATPVAADSTACASRRNGKIARLPCEIRQEINHLISDGVPYPAIVKKIAACGHRLNESNLSRWFSGGYQDWLQEQACLEEMRARLDFASKVINDENGQLIDQASLRIAVLRLYNLLTDFDPAVLKSKIADHPGSYARILNALCKLTEGGLKFERHRLSSQNPFASIAAALK